MDMLVKAGHLKEAFTDIIYNKYQKHMFYMSLFLVGFSKANETKVFHGKGRLIIQLQQFYAGDLFSHSIWSGKKSKVPFSLSRSKRLVHPGLVIRDEP